MPLNKSTGNMYPWVTHTLNPIRGRCPHECSYCYMKGFVHGEARFIESELKTNLKSGLKIFVGSSIDMWAEEIPGIWLAEVLRKCRLNTTNYYLFQTKNPIRIVIFTEAFPMDQVMIGTTIESNRDYPSISKAPVIEERAYWMREVHYRLEFETMISIEPILDFDLNHFIRIVNGIRPVFVSIGADSKGHHLPEPSSEKTLALIEALKEITEVRIKDNLRRLL